MNTESIKAERARLQALADQHLAITRLYDAASQRPSDLALIQVIADEYDIAFHEAADWIVSVGMEHAA